MSNDSIKLESQVDYCIHALVQSGLITIDEGKLAWTELSEHLSDKEKAMLIINASYEREDKQ